MRKVLASLFVDAAVCAVTLPTSSTPVQAAARSGRADEGKGPRFVPNEILIQFEDGATEGRKADARPPVGAMAAEIRNAILSSAAPTPSLAGKCTTGGRLNVSGF